MPTKKQEKFRKAVAFMTPRTDKWGTELIQSMKALDLDEEQLEALFIWIVERLLDKAPYPNKKIVETLGHIIIDISRGDALFDLDWGEREKRIL